MIKLIAVASFALSLATSAQAMTPAPVPQTDNDMITQIAAASGPGRTRVNGVCVARTTIRQTRRELSAGAHDGKVVFALYTSKGRHWRSICHDRTPVLCLSAQSQGST
jgi:hypothetical protein